jgi:hypothetical protein
MQQEGKKMTEVDREMAIGYVRLKFTANIIRRTDAEISERTRNGEAVEDEFYKKAYEEIRNVVNMLVIVR